MICIQAWALRRMISVYNLVTRRPHVPRELALRRILRSQGFDVPLEASPRPGPSPGSTHGAQDDGDEDDLMEESPESEENTDDECLMDDVENGNTLEGSFGSLWYDFAFTKTRP